MVRKDLKISREHLSRKDLVALFRSIDLDGNGVLDIEVAYALPPLTPAIAQLALPPDIARALFSYSTCLLPLSLLTLSG